MLDVGKRENEKLSIFNAEYVVGLAEEMPFENDSFDIVGTRLSFHHLVNAKDVLKEMLRVVKPGGRIVIIDMLAREESLRERADYLEKRRDPSHVRCLSQKEFEDMLEENGAEITYLKTTYIKKDLESWFNLTKTGEEVRNEVLRAINEELEGGKKTGFMPYKENGEIYFKHHWIQIIAQKK